MVWLSTFGLGVVLFWPLRILMLAATVSWYQHITQERITHETIASLRQRTSIMAVVVALTVAVLLIRLMFFLYFS